MSEEKQLSPSGSSSGENLEEALQKADPNLLSKLKKEEIGTLKKVVSATIAESIHYSGPIPPPEILAKFNEIIPNGADRIMRMAENQSSHRIAIETKVIHSQQSQSQLGQIFAFIIGIFGLSLSGYLILKGHDAAGSALAAGALGSLVYTFITGKKDLNNDLAKKRPRKQ